LDRTDGSEHQKSLRKPAIFRRIVALMDHLLPARGAFSYALEWASQLHLPLHAIVLPGNYPGQEETQGTVADRVSACTAAAAQRGVVWESSRWESGAVNRIAHMIGPADLFVVGSATPETEKMHLFRYGLRHSESAVLICPGDWASLHRVLVLHEDRPHQESFLASALDLCRRWQAKPIILTVARSERRANVRQHFLQELLNHSGIDCEFDLLVGAEVRMAVARVMRWRQCQLIMMERQAAPPWWRWWQSDTAEKFLRLAKDCSLLALPGVNVLVASGGQAHKRPTSQDPINIPFFQ
jgi:nucleotide-binding universal stress UspA family protein